MSYEPFLRLVAALRTSDVRFVVIGVSAANYYARSASEIFATQERDLFIAPDAANLLAAGVAHLLFAARSWPMGYNAGQLPTSQAARSDLGEAAVRPRSSIRWPDFF
jgi:hypothetical protein